MKAYSIPSIPNDLDPRLRNVLVAMKNALEALAPNTEPLDSPSNLTVTPLPGGNKIQFTRSNGESYTLYIGSTPDITQAQAVGLGTSTEYSHIVGQAAVTRYYWVVANASNKKDSLAAGPVSGLTLALGTAAATPVTPPTYDPNRRRPETYVDELSKQ